jgi:hypothetical protein
LTKFMRRGKSQAVFTLTCGNINAPTVGNITGGTNLSASINDLSGFSFANSPIDVPDLSTSFVSKIPGPDEVDDSTITYYIDSASNPLHTTLAKDVVGFIILADYKILGTWTAGDKVDVWPVQVASNAKQYSMGDDPALSEVTFVGTSTPALNVTVV